MRSYGLDRVQRSETTAALNSARLTDVPMRIVAPQPRSRWQPELAKEGAVDSSDENAGVYW